MGLLECIGGERVRICLVILSKGWGGAENSVYHLAKTLGEIGYDVHLIINDEIYPFFKLLESYPHVTLHNIGPTFNCLNILKINFGINFLDRLSFPSSISRILNFISAPFIRHLNYVLRTKRRFLRVITNINPDIINFNNPITLEFYFHICKYLSDYPKVYTARGLDLEQRIHPIDKILDITRKWLLYTFEAIIFVSPYFFEYFAEKGIHNLKKQFVIPNGINLGFNPNHVNVQIRKRGKINSFKVIFPGGDKTRKGGKFAVEGLGRTNCQLPMYLYVAGPISQGILKKIVMEKNLEKKVFFLGLLSKEKYIKVLTNMDAVLLPDKDYWPGGVAMEALFFKVPLLTTKFKYTHGVFKEYYNYIPIQQDPEDIAKKLGLICTNPKLRKKMIASKYVREKLESFYWENVAKKYIEVFHKISNLEKHLDEPFQ